MDESIITAAKSSLVFAYARKEKTMGAAAATAFVNETLKGVPLRFGREFLSRVQVRPRPPSATYPPRQHPG